VEIVLATRNRKKVEEIRRITEGMDVSVLTVDNFPGCPEVEEDGMTFEENAVKKAVAVAGYTGRPALADDSGLEVYALNGAPGIRSARYAGKDADDARNMEKLLHEMKSVANRSARFACFIAFAFPGGETSVFHGYAEGSIGRKPRGVRGFGYDPVFYPAGFKRTFAEMSDEDKDSLSHRGRALREFQRYLVEKMKLSHTSGRRQV
jgi:XTP/dITP diphosphohydrolase